MVMLTCCKTGVKAIGHCIAQEARRRASSQEGYEIRRTFFERRPEEGYEIRRWPRRNDSTPEPPTTDVS
jgi:hypothetical protein